MSPPELSGVVLLWDKLGTLNSVNLWRFLLNFSHRFIIYLYVWSIRWLLISQLDILVVLNFQIPKSNPVFKEIQQEAAWFCPWSLNSNHELCTPALIPRTRQFHSHTVCVGPSPLSVREPRAAGVKVSFYVPHTPGKDLEGWLLNTSLFSVHYIMLMCTNLWLKSNYVNIVAFWLQMLAPIKMITFMFWVTSHEMLFLSIPIVPLLSPCHSTLHMVGAQ